MTVSCADIRDAARQLSGIAVATPLITSAELDRRAAGTVYLKPECLQRTGSFKIRGAYNLMSRLSPERAARGVVAWSSGNHAQGVAAAGQLLGIHTAIVMPEDAPRAKLEATQQLGGETVLYDRYSEDREGIARELAAQRGAELVPSYDHVHIIAGQGTVGLEIATEAAALGLQPDQVLICCGGGGLSSGSAIALQDSFPGLPLYTVEPDQFDDTARSLKTARRQCVDPQARSICDALQAHTPGELTFAINQQRIAGGLAVSDDEVITAMRFAFEHLRLVLEPGGAVALAAVLAGKVETAGRTTIAVLSGGNVDADLYAKLMRAA